MSDYNRALSELVNSGIIPEEEHKENIKSTDEIITDELSRITGVPFSDEQRKCIEHRGSGIILACAGSGKTSVLTNVLAKRIWNREILDTSKVICTTYSRAGAEEMSVRLNKLLDKVGIKCNLEIRTLHSFFKSLIETFGITGYKVISQSVRTQYIRESCKEVGYNCKDDDLMIIDNLISYRVNNLLNDAKTIGSPACTISELTVEQFSGIRKGYDFRKAQNNYIDFDDMQLYIYKWLCVDTQSEDEETRKTGEAVRNYCRALYNDFYIDEAQDVSKIQYAIVKAIVTDSDGKLDKKLMFIGDDDQCIYKWRGASPEIILTLGSTMNIGNFVLSTNYRCKKEIVNFAHRSIKYNNTRYNKGMTAMEDGGIVDIQQCNSNNLYEMSKIAVDKVMEIVNGGEDLGDIALLCRNNAHLSLVNTMLVDYGIYCRVPDEMKLTRSYMYNDIKGLIELTKNTYSGKIAGQLTWKLCTFMQASVSRAIGTFQEDNGLSYKDTILYIAKEVLGMTDVNLNQNITVNTKAAQKIKYTLSRLKQETIDDLIRLRYTVDIEDNNQRFISLLSSYVNGTTFIYKNEDKRRIMLGIALFIRSLIEEKGFDEAISKLRTIEQLECSSFTPPKRTITMSTIHGAKGREWRNVVFFACDNEAIPGLSGLSLMLDRGMGKSDINDLIDEERRLYYVACTRAKDRLVIITSTKPSAFLMESLGEYYNVSGSNNENIINMIGNDRKKVIDNGIITDKQIEDTIDERRKNASSSDTGSYTYDSNSGGNNTSGIS